MGLNNLVFDRSVFYARITQTKGMDMKKIFFSLLAAALLVASSASAQTWKKVVETSDYVILTTQLVSGTATITNPVSTTLGKDVRFIVKPNGGSGISASYWVSPFGVSGTGTTQAGYTSATAISDGLVTAADGSATRVIFGGARSAGVAVKFLAGATEKVSITAVVAK